MIKEFFSWIWFILCLPYHMFMFYTGQSGGQAGLESEFDYPSDEDKKDA